MRRKNATAAATTSGRSALVRTKAAAGVRTISGKAVTQTGPNRISVPIHQSSPAIASAQEAAPAMKLPFTPKGARGDWLPSSEWVMSSWMPFDEARLYSVLGTDRGELATWLNDHRTLGAFAQRQRR